SGWHRGASTDMGDLGEVMPVLHPFTSGAVGDAHSHDYQVTDHVTAAVEPAVLLAWCVIDLLGGGAGEARRILEARGQRRPAAEVRSGYEELRAGFDSTGSFDGRIAEGEK
ncbi:MAG TPA: hypothetical protein VNS49_00985, partial [Streptomyces sp.]|nr:hypothetical protein [Streptomyces sp.]